MLHRSEPCMVVLSGLEAFCRHHRSISHKTENVIQVNNKQDISTDISNVFTLSSSWVLTATWFCNKCVLQQYGFTDSFSSKGPFQRARGLFGLICLLACSSSCRAARKDFTLSLTKKKKKKNEYWCARAQQRSWNQALTLHIPTLMHNKEHSSRKIADAANYKRIEISLHSILTIQTSCLAT